MVFVEKFEAWIDPDTVIRLQKNEVTSHFSITIAFSDGGSSAVSFESKKDMDTAFEGISRKLGLIEEFDVIDFVRKISPTHVGVSVDLLILDLVSEFCELANVRLVSGSSIVPVVNRSNSKISLSFAVEVVVFGDVMIPAELIFLANTEKSKKAGEFFMNQGVRLWKQ